MLQRALSIGGGRGVTYQKGMYIYAWPRMAVARLVKSRRNTASLVNFLAAHVVIGNWRRVSYLISGQRLIWLK